MLNVSYIKNDHENKKKIATHVFWSIYRRAGESNCWGRLSKGMGEMYKILYKSSVLHRLLSFGLFTDGRVKVTAGGCPRG